MTPIRYFLILFLIFMVIAILSRISLMETMISNAGLDSGEFYAGLGGILLLFSTIWFVLSYR